MHSLAYADVMNQVDLITCLLSIAIPRQSELFPLLNYLLQIHLLAHRNIYLFFFFSFEEHIVYAYINSTSLCLLHLSSNRKRAALAHLCYPLLDLMTTDDHIIFEMQRPELYAQSIIVAKQNFSFVPLLYQHDQFLIFCSSCNLTFLEKQLSYFHREVSRVSTEPTLL